MSVKEPAAALQQLKGKPVGSNVAAGDLPTLAQLGLRPLSQLPNIALVRGGEPCGASAIAYEAIVVQKLCNGDKAGESLGVAVWYRFSACCVCSAEDSEG